jgi:sugar/nucleoside kinase (ribokinase family)
VQPINTCRDAPPTNPPCLPRTHRLWLVVSVTKTEWSLEKKRTQGCNHRAIMLGLFCLVALAHRAIASSSSCGPNATFLTMGESMLRLQPIDSGPVTSPTRHFPQPFLRSIGGDELNVAVALSLVGVPSRWISVLPTGPLGDVIIDSCVHHSVECVGPRVEGDLGLYWVLPEEKRVHYQRRNAAFARHDPSILEWTALLDAPSPWLHLTGITPLISDAARRSWVAALTHAASQGIPISVDLNHRPQLGSLAEVPDR